MENSNKQNNDLKKTESKVLDSVFKKLEDIESKLNENKLTSDNDFLTHEQTMQFLGGVSYSWVDKLASEGIINKYKLLGKNYYKKSEIIEAMTKAK